MPDELDIKQILDNLEKDLESVSAPKQAHIQIQNIIGAYKQRFATNGQAEETEN